VAKTRKSNNTIIGKMSSQWVNQFTVLGKSPWVVAEPFSEISSSDSVYWMFILFFIFSALVCPWLNFGLTTWYPQVVWCYWREIEQYSAKMAQNGLAEYDQSGNIPLKFRHSQKLNPGYGEDRQWDTFIFPLTYVAILDRSFFILSRKDLFRNYLSN